MILELTYLWSEEFPVRTTVRWSGVSEKTVIDWYNFCRDTCTEYMRRNLTVIGGPGKVVDFDEAKFGNRKYNRCHYRDGHWVIGGIEQGTKKSCLTERCSYSTSINSKEHCCWFHCPNR